MNERKIVGSSYIVNFYQSIYLLTSETCAYTNLLLELKTKYGEDINPKKMEESELNILGEKVQTVRYHAKMFYVQYKSICPSLNIEENKGLEELYEKVKKEYILTDETITDFIIEVNKLLLNNVIRDLLMTSQNLLDQIYGSPTSEGESGKSGS